MNFDWKGHASMLGANVMWGLMSPVSKVILVGGAITPLVTVSYTHLTLPTTPYV